MRHRKLFAILFIGALAGCGTPGLTTPLEDLPPGMLLGRCTDYQIEVDGYLTDSGGRGTGCQCIGNDLELLRIMQAQCEGAAR